jgi:hypothetical protein
MVPNNGFNEEVIALINCLGSVTEESEKPDTVASLVHKVCNEWTPEAHNQLLKLNAFTSLAMLLRGFRHK